MSTATATTFVDTRQSTTSSTSSTRAPAIPSSRSGAQYAIPENLGFGDVTGEATEREPDALPTLEQLKEAAADSVLDQDGQPVRFSSILSAKYNIVVFIRHFRCGLCQDFLIYLAAQDRLQPEVLRKAGAKLLIIGCGDPAYIKAYKEIVEIDCEVYANPSASLYKTLQMSMEKGINRNTTTFYTGSFASMILHSIARALRFSTLRNILNNAGNVQQLGGEFVFALNAAACLFAHRMRNSSDHSRPEVILDCCGADYFSAL